MSFYVKKVGNAGAKNLDEHKNIGNATVLVLGNLGFQILKEIIISFFKSGSCT